MGRFCILYFVFCLPIRKDLRSSPVDDIIQNTKQENFVFLYFVFRTLRSFHTLLQNTKYKIQNTKYKKIIFLFCILSRHDRYGLTKYKMNSFSVLSQPRSLRSHKIQNEHLFCFCRVTARCG